MDLPVTAPLVVPGPIPTIPWVSIISGWEVPRRWPVIRPAIAIWIGRRWVVTPVRVVVTATRVIIHGASGRRSVPPTPIVIIFGWRRATPGTPLTVAIAVRIAAGAVAAGWATSIVVVYRRHERTPARRAGAGAISQRHVWLGLVATLGHAQLFHTCRAGGTTYICEADNRATLEIATVKFLYCGPKIGSILKLDEPSAIASVRGSDSDWILGKRKTYPRPVPSRPVSEYTTSRLDCRAKSLRSYFQKSA